MSTSPFLLPIISTCRISCMCATSCVCTCAHSYLHTQITYRCMCAKGGCNKLMPSFNSPINYFGVDYHQSIVSVLCAKSEVPLCHVDNAEMLCRLYISSIAQDACLDVRRPNSVVQKLGIVSVCLAWEAATGISVVVWTEDITSKHFFIREYPFDNLFDCKLKCVCHVVMSRDGSRFALLETCTAFDFSVDIAFLLRDARMYRKVMYDTSSRVYNRILDIEITSIEVS